MDKYCVGVDVGGTTVKLGLFQTNGRLIFKWEIPTRKEDTGRCFRCCPRGTERAPDPPGTGSWCRSWSTWASTA